MRHIIFIAIILLNSINYSQDFKLIGPPNNRETILKYATNNFNKLFVGNSNASLISCYNDGEIKKILFPGIDVSRGEQLVTFPQDTNSLYFNSNGYLFRTIDGGDNWVYEDGETYFPAFVAINPLNENIIYKYKESKMYKSINNGRNWSLLYTFPYSTLYPTLAVSLSDTSKIYIALRDFSYLHLYSSSNSGADWSEVIHSGALSFAFKLELNPYNSESLYLQLNNSVFKSMDGGKSFTQIGPPHISGFTIDMLDTLNFYFRSNEQFYIPYGLFVKSTDEGHSWFSLNRNFPSEILFNSPVINPVNSQELYVCCDMGTYKSMDGGVNWEEVFLGGESIFSYCVNLNNPDKIVTANNYTAYGIKTTTNGGETWFTPVTDTILPHLNNFYHDLEFDPSNPDKGFLTSDQALYQTSDGGITWSKNSFPYSWARTIAISPSNPDVILVCTIDEPTGYSYLYRSLDGGNSWELRNSLGPWYNGFFKMIFDPTDEQKIYLNKHVNDSLVVSTDQGLTWSNARQGLSIYARITQVWINPKNPLEMYCSEASIGANPGSFNMSTNGGESWFQIDLALNALTEEPDVQGFWIDPDNTDRIYLGLGAHNQYGTNEYTSGGLYFTDNHGEGWIKIFNSEVNKIIADNSNPRKIYFNSKFGLIRFTDSLVTGIDDIKPDLPNEYKLLQNYPNPFNPSTTINYAVGSMQFLTIKVYDILGREISTLVNQEKQAGNYEVNWNTANLSSGVYFYRLRAGNFIDTKKMTLIK